MNKFFMGYRYCLQLTIVNRQIHFSTGYKAAGGPIKIPEVVAHSVSYDLQATEVYKAE